MKRKAVSENVKAGGGAQKPRLSDSAHEAKQSDVAATDVKHLDVKRYAAQCVLLQVSPLYYCHRYL